jgi:hypothetical protein
MKPVPDPFAQTIRLSVKITNGQICLADDQPVPKLKEGCTAELVLSSSDFTDAKELAHFTQEWWTDFLPQGTVLMARVNDDPIKPELKNYRVAHPHKSHFPYLFVAFQLTEPLRLKVRAGKNGQLDECECFVPALDKKFKSVNEAYTAISTAFESSRRSHAGNVFLCVYVEEGDKLRPLKELRIQKESEPRPPQQQEELDLS